MKNMIIALLFSFFLFACSNGKVVKDSDVIYTCSMDPQVLSDKPGKCPICGMTLTPVKKSAVKNTDDLELSDQQIQLGNIEVDTIGQGNIGSELELTGILAQNAAQTASVSARVTGRIEKLYVKTTGDYIKKGAPLYELYSEQLNTVKQEYIAALQRRQQFAGQSLIDFDELIGSARNKLQLWGMSESQINALAGMKQAPFTTTFYSPESGYITTLNVTEGGYVGEGGSIIELANLSTLWAEAQVYTSQMSGVRTGAAATVMVPGLSSGIKGRVEFSNPEVSPDTRINLLRVVIPNPGGQLRPGMSALVRVQTASRNSLTLPTDAVIRQQGGATVWVQSGKNMFQSRMVTTGLESGGLIEINSGLKAGDVVVVNGVYLLHSEFVFKRGADPMTGHNH
ncbi:efflux RND transporter periplasmic adaptor subunit [Paracnuella aquatica]|uniref:efflux RND transporter periplasmic adaptor subunit n=1 Tax=Paracnuella aquatica TaxID=2268757 RepID=UPI000DEED8FB|nr:efflux RND transporter periplasmic adaptor subunit [Paracnuella aquatica]RPD51146.1 efflux RND transporter periplasmic adaptor subunit [Paracnuella aquatica]